MFFELVELVKSAGWVFKRNRKKIEIKVFSFIIHLGR